MSLANIVKLGWNMLGRDRRSGELRLLMLSLVVAVAALTSVSFFVDRLRSGLERNAAQLLGADLVLIADQPIGDAIRAEARKRALSIAETVAFSSMALAHNSRGKETEAVTEAETEARTEPRTEPRIEPKSQLASVKAVSAAYPLRGKLSLASGPGLAGEKVQGQPAAGTVWVDAALLAPLQVGVGDSIQLGEARFTITRTIALEPDRGLSFANLAPRVMIRIDDLPATQLIQTGSRETRRLMFAGTPEAISGFRGWLEARLVRGQRLETIESGQPQVRATLDRAGRFLALVAFLTAMLAAVAVMLAARRFTQRHLDGCAVMRCLGISQRDLLRLYTVEFALIGVIGAAVGVALGYAAHFVLIDMLGPIVGLKNKLESAGMLPQPGVLPALQGFILGFVLLIGFALPPVVQLRHVPPVRVLRRDVGLPRSMTALGYLIGAGLFTALLVWTAGNLKIGFITAGGFIAGFAVFSLVSWLLLRLVGALRHRPEFNSRLSASWRFALASMTRRPAAVVAQTVALAIGLMALLLLSVTRNDLMRSWHNSIPPDAPNRFVINIQPDQRAAFREQMGQAGLTAYDFSPMVRGRLTSVNGRAITENTYSDEAGEGGAQRLVNREFNLSYMNELPAHNRVSAGRWFDRGSTDEVSVEAGLAKTLRLKLGDTVAFDIAGVTAAGKITSLRKLDWDSMHVNFFVIFPPAALASMAQTTIAAFHLSDTNRDLGNRLVGAFPNITIIDTGAVLQQIQNILDQVVAAIEFLFVFTLLAGLLVLHAALLSSRDERTREAALLRALGASRRQLSRVQLAEFVCVGVLAGGMAAAGAVATGFVLASRVFDLSYAFDITPWVWGIAGGAAIAVVGGWLGLRPVLNRPPLASLREI